MFVAFEIKEILSTSDIDCCCLAAEIKEGAKEIEINQKLFYKVLARIA